MLLIALLQAAPIEPPAPRPALFTGAFRGVEVGSGFVLGDGWGLDVGARASTVLHLADVTLNWRMAAADSTTHFAAAGMRLHPLFLFLLANNRFGATIGSLYGEVGAGARFGATPRATWHWGLGWDLPLSALDAGGWWLGGGLIQTRSFTESDTEDDVTTFVSLRLGYRLNGL